jgi:hypothetical protein
MSRHLLPPRLAVLLALIAASPLAAQARLTYGASATGRLTLADSQFSDGTRYRAYAFTGARGDTIVAELASDDFDAMLLLMDEAGNKITTNDDAGGSCNARIQHVLPAAGAYLVYANAHSPNGVGEYQLRLTRGPGPAPPPPAPGSRPFHGLRRLIQVGASN